MIARTAGDPWARPQVQIDLEPDEHGRAVRSAAVFLVGRQCAWHCVMCDLWRHMTEEDTPPGAIAQQVRLAAEWLALTGDVPSQIKLYNAGSFLDTRAVPPSDYPAIALALRPFARVVIESHPALIGPRLDAWQAVCPAPLEVAMGLETAHPEALRRLSKGMTVEGFALAARGLAARGVALRVFLLVHPPFVPIAEQDQWLTRSVETAFECGAAVVSLIPLRAGNGAMDDAIASGEAVVPTVRDLERAAVLAHRASKGRVLVDLWDFDALAGCPECAPLRRQRLDATNRTQATWPPVICATCGVTE
jgi:radical SAM enzyme (TIGR01210 family)